MGVAQLLCMYAQTSYKLPLLVVHISFSAVLSWIGRIVALPSPAAEIDHEDEGEDDGEGEETRQRQHQHQHQERQQEQHQEKRPATRTAAFPSDLVSPRVGTAVDGFHKKVRELAVWVYPTQARCCGVMVLVSCGGISF